MSTRWERCRRTNERLLAAGCLTTPSWLHASPLGKRTWRHWPGSAADHPATAGLAAGPPCDHHEFSARRTRAGGTGSGFWRSWAGLATAAALALLTFVLATPMPAPQLVAVLNDDAGHPLWVVRASAEDSRLLARPLVTATPMTQVPELWLLSAAGRAPVSLGVLDRFGNNRRALVEPVQNLLRVGDVLAVSLEPQGGSPTGQPTGPVVSTGTLVAELM